MTGYDVDVLVIGGGAMGSAAAWRLAGRGVETLLLERFEPGHVRGASHGTSRIFRISYPDPVHVALAREALGSWRDLEAESGAELLTTTGGCTPTVPSRPVTTRTGPRSCTSCRPGGTTAGSTGWARRGRG